MRDFRLLAPLTFKLALLMASSRFFLAHGFSFVSPPVVGRKVVQINRLQTTLLSSSVNTVTESSVPSEQKLGNILILDHLNINHEKGRHDWLKAFYFDFLGCAVDPRKAENLASGKKTLWANIGANQFHLPEGKPDAQVLDGIVTLVYVELSGVEERLSRAKEALAGSKFECQVVRKDDDDGVAVELKVADPWGSRFRLVAGSEKELDIRGLQKGDVSEGLALRDLTVYTPVGSSMHGIARFYQLILNAPVQHVDESSCVITVGPRQTLTFQTHPQGHSDVSHADLRDDKVEPPAGFDRFLSNYGPHISMYVADLRSSYEKADKLGLAYVNPRFKRRAYTIEEAVDDCMFRCLDIVDPENPGDGAILQLEHEVRSVVKRDGSKYKSCPFDKIPEECLQ